MTTPTLVLSELTLNAIQMEATRAHLKHGEYSMLELVKELIQVAAMAASWVEQLEGHRS